MIQFTVPGKVKGKGRPRFARIGKFVKTYTPEDTINYENWIKTCFIQAYPSFTPLETPLMVKVFAKFVKPKSNKMSAPMTKPDIDNVIKCLDALNGIAYKDDKQIVNMTAVKYWADKEELLIEIVELG